MRQINSLILVILMILSIALVFSPGLNNGFTNWDDDQYVKDNPLVKNWSWAALVRLFTAPFARVYAPLTFVSLALDFRIYGSAPVGFHATNIFLHLINVLLAFAVFYSLSRDRGTAFLTALLFGLHPLRVESVVWITERKDVLYAAFFLTSLLVYLRSKEKLTTGPYIVILIFFLLALLAKPMAVTLPAILLLLAFHRNAKTALRQSIALIPLGVVSALFVIINFRAQQAAPAGFGDYIRHFFVGSYNLIFYLVKTAAPIRLSAFYPYPPGWPGRSPWIMATAPFLTLLIAAAVICGRRCRPLVLASLWYFIILFPVSQFVPLPGPAMAADRFTYLASLGPFFLLSWSVVTLFRRISRRGLRILIVIIVFAAAAACGVISARRCRVWHDGISLWSDVIRYNPGLALAYDNRGIALAQAGKLDAALADFDQALKIDPRLVKAFYNRGLLYYQAGAVARALEDINQAIRLNPRNARFLNTRGIIFADQNDQVHALLDFSTALEIDPGYPEAYNNRGIIRRIRGELAPALADFNRALGLDPGFTDAYYNRAVVHLLMNNFPAVEADLKAFTRLGGKVPAEFYQDLERRRRCLNPN